MATDASEVPTLAEWAGGPDKLKALFEAFYARVPNDPILAPVFAHMDPHHAQHVAAFVGEVFGGPKACTEAGGGHAAMIRKHMGRHLTQEQRRAWVALMLDTADAVGLPDDPEFRAAFVGYLEWGTPGGDQLGRGRSRAGGRAAHAGVGLGPAGRPLAGLTGLGVTCRLGPFGLTLPALNL